VNEIACNELIEAITAYLDGTLPEHDRRRFDAHVAECASCTEYLRQDDDACRARAEAHEAAACHPIGMMPRGRASSMLRQRFERKE
jgi:anti-sigma factor RsiW